jgi:hypothetical protein
VPPRRCLLPFSPRRFVGGFLVEGRMGAAIKDGGTDDKKADTKADRKP